MKAFVTGATGFIGRRLVKKLICQGCEVVALVRCKGQSPSNVTEVIRGDILEPASFEAALRGCDVLYHLAAEISFDTARRETLLQVNGRGTANVLAAARRREGLRSVVVSSACTMGLSFSPSMLLDEKTTASAKLAAKNPYMASKLVAEEAVHHAASFQFVVSVNPTTVYGPGDRTLNAGTLVKKVARSAVLPVPSGGSNVVDVDDVVNGIIAAGKRGHSGCRYILGGENLSFFDIFSTIATVVGHRPLLIPFPPITKVPLAMAAGTMGRLTGSRLLTPQIVRDMYGFKYYSSRRAEKVLGWSPQYRFQDSVQRAWHFYTDQGLV